MGERYRLSPTGKRRREIIEDVEHMISFTAGALSTLIVGVFLRALGLI